jgi:hypothetical protein
MAEMREQRSYDGTDGSDGIREPIKLPLTLRINVSEVVKQVFR